MSPENQPNDLKLKALPILQAIFEQNIPYRARIAGEVIAEQFGISSDEAMDMVIKFVEARQMNELHGSTLKLPKVRQISPEAPFTKLEIHAANFTVAYLEEVLSIEQQYPLGLNYLGRFWLGNSEGETKTLVSWMQQNPEKVADYLEWVIKPQPNENNLAEEFRVRARENKLIEPKFE